MTKIAYVNKQFRSDTYEIINTANDIIAEYAAQGLSLTLRQLYYRFVTRGLPNTEKSYNRLGDVINDARLAGLIDWEAIVDRTRHLIQNVVYSGPADVIGTAALSYRRNLWEGQTFRPEIWIEKNALIDVIHGVCTELDVPHFACVGYNSQSEMWEAGQRLLEYECKGYTPIVMYLGDHDPSGLDMSRDIEDRLTMFTGGPVRIARLALNIGQVEQYGLAPNPTKMTDSRAEDYVRQFGSQSWELDALEPQVIIDLVRKSIEDMTDKSALKKAQECEKADIKQLYGLTAYWEEISNYIGMRTASS